MGFFKKLDTKIKNKMTGRKLEAESKRINEAIRYKERREQLEKEMNSRKALSREKKAYEKIKQQNQKLKSAGKVSLSNSKSIFDSGKSIFDSPTPKKNEKKWRIG